MRGAEFSRMKEHIPRIECALATLLWVLCIRWVYADVIRPLFRPVIVRRELEQSWYACRDATSNRIAIDLPCSVDNPKILWVHDVEIIADGVAQQVYIAKSQRKKKET